MLGSVRQQNNLNAICSSKGCTRKSILFGFGESPPSSPQQAVGHPEEVLYERLPNEVTNRASLLSYMVIGDEILWQLDRDLSRSEYSRWGCGGEVVPPEEPSLRK